MISDIFISGKYRPRIVDEQISRYLRTFGAVCIEGPKWCGKTWSALRHAESATFIMDPQNNFAVRRMSAIDLNFALDGEMPHLIDEWQEIPELWDAVRFRVDQNAEKGAYILTGSSTPVTGSVLHSGVGRIARIRMRPMSLYESGVSHGKVSLKNLFSGTPLRPFSDNTSVRELARLVVRGGWPGGLELDFDDALEVPRQYVQITLATDIESVGPVRRDMTKFRRLLQTLARNESTTVSNRTLKRDMEGSEGESISLDTIASYLDVLERLFLLDNQLPFSPNVRSSLRVKQSVKRHFVDPSLACAILGITDESLLSDPETFGFMFESLCERDLRVYAERLGGRLLHYQDYKNREIDAVVELPDGKWGAFEIKLGANSVDAAAENLLKIADTMESNAKPSFLCVLCGLPGGGYRRDDGVYVVPIKNLGP